MQHPPNFVTGLCRAIGVSNFLICHLNELKDLRGVVPHVNQVWLNFSHFYISSGQLFTLQYHTCSCTCRLNIQPDALGLIEWFHVWIWFVAGGVPSLPAANRAGWTLSERRYCVWRLLSSGQRSGSHSPHDSSAGPEIRPKRISNLHSLEYSSMHFNISC